MSNYLVALAIAGAMSVPAAAQTTQPPQPAQAPTTNQAQPVQPQMVKKTVCEDNDNPYSNIHRLCRTVMVPAKPAPNQQAQTPPQPNVGN